jgi:hypothetical protein
MNYFSSLIIALFLLSSCEKQAFKIISVKGKLIDKHTGVPLRVNVALYTIKRSSANGKEGASEKLHLTECPTSPDGSFTLHTHASKVDSYFLAITDGSEDHRTVFSGNNASSGFSANDHHTTDLGEVRIDP